MAGGSKIYAGRTYGPVPFGLLRVLTHRKLKVLTVLAGHANDKAEAWPSPDTLAELSGVKRNHVFEALRDLEGCGVIVRSGRAPERSKKRSRGEAPCKFLIPFIENLSKVANESQIGTTNSSDSSESSPGLDRNKSRSGIETSPKSGPRNITGKIKGKRERELSPEKVRKEDDDASDRDVLLASLERTLRSLRADIETQASVARYLKSYRDNGRPLIDGSVPTHTLRAELFKMGGAEDEISSREVRDLIAGAIKLSRDVREPLKSLWGAKDIPHNLARAFARDLTHDNCL